MQIPKKFKPKRNQRTSPPHMFLAFIPMSSICSKSSLRTSAEIRLRSKEMLWILRYTTKIVSFWIWKRELLVICARKIWSRLKLNITKRRSSFIDGLRSSCVISSGVMIAYQKMKNSSTATVKKNTSNIAAKSETNSNKNKNRSNKWIMTSKKKKTNSTVNKKSKSSEQ